MTYSVSEVYTSHSKLRELNCFESETSIREETRGKDLKIKKKIKEYWNSFN